jgi:hypothetical protein
MLVLLDFCKFAPKCISVVVNCKSGVLIKMGVLLVGGSLKETSFEFPRDGTLFPLKWNRSQSETEFPFFEESSENNPLKQSPTESNNFLPIEDGITIVITVTTSSRIRVITSQCSQNLH